MDTYDSEKYLFFQSVDSGSISIAKSILSKGFEVDKLNMFNEAAIHMAARNNNPDMINLLISFNCNINLQNSYGLTALMISAMAGSENAFKALLKSESINVDLKSNDNKSAEDYAKDSGKTKILSLLYSYLSMKKSWSEDKDKEKENELSNIQRRHSALNTFFKPTEKSNLNNRKNSKFELNKEIFNQYNNLKESNPTNKSKSSTNVFSDLKVNKLKEKNNFLSQMSHFEEKLDKLKKEIMNTSSYSKIEQSSSCVNNDDSYQNNKLSKSLKLSDNFSNILSNNLLYTQQLTAPSIHTQITEADKIEHREYKDKEIRKNTYDPLLKSYNFNRHTHSQFFRETEKDSKNNSFNQENSYYTSKFGLKDPYMFTIGSNINSIRKENNQNLIPQQNVNSIRINPININNITSDENKKNSLNNSPYSKVTQINRRNTWNNPPHTVTNFRTSFSKSNLPAQTHKEKTIDSAYHRVCQSQLNSKNHSKKDNVVLNDSKITGISTINNKSNQNVIITLRNTDYELSAKNNLDSYNLPLQVSSRNKKDFIISQRTKEKSLSTFQSPSGTEILKFCGLKESKSKCFQTSTSNSTNNLSQSRIFNIKLIKEFFIEKDKALIFFHSYKNDIESSSYCDDNTKIYDTSHLENLNSNFSKYNDINASQSRLEGDQDFSYSDKDDKEMSNHYNIENKISYPRSKAKPVNARKEEDNFEIKDESPMMNEIVPIRVINNTVEEVFNSELTTANPNININNHLKEYSNNDVYLLLLGLNMEEYFPYFVKGGYDDLDLMIEQIKSIDGNPISHNDLRAIGIKKPGDRARIILKLEEISNLFNFTVPGNAYYCNKQLDTNDHQSKILENWLNHLKMQGYISKFLNNGIYSLEQLFLQSITKSPFTDEILEKEIKIEKIGYRARLLNKIKTDTKDYIGKLRNSSLSFKKEEEESCKCIVF